MKTKVIFVLFLAALFTPSSVFAIIPDIDIKIVRERDFVGKALYGFMNGGSDLYLEYGFKDLKALEIVYKGGDYTVEIYRMSTPEDAYGIYSQLSFRCVSADSARLYDCASNYQLQASVKDLYISVVFTTVSRNAKQGAYELIDHYSSLYASGEEVNLPAELGIKGVISGRLKYMVGEISASNLKPSLMPLLEGIESYKIWLLKGAGEGEDHSDKRDRIFIVCKTSGDIGLIKQRITAGEVEGLNSIVKEGDKFLVFCL